MSGTDTWNGGNGSWNSTNWSTGAPPGSMQIAILNQGTTETLTYNYSSTIGGLYADAATTIDLQSGLLAIANTDTSFAGAENQYYDGVVDQTGGTLSLAQGVQFIGTLAATAGTVSVAGGAELLTNSGTIDGTLSGPGAFLFNSGTAVIGAGAVVTVGTLAFGGGVPIDLGENLTYGGAFLVGGSDTINLGGNTLTLTGRAAFASGDVITGPGTLVLAGNASLSGVSTAGTVTVIDSGIVAVSYGLALANNSTAIATVSITPTGTLDLIDDNGIATSGTATVENAGLFEKTAGGGSSQISVGYTQAASGTLDVLHGTVQFNVGPSLAGRVTGAGGVVFNSGTVSIAAGTSIDVGSLAENSGTFAPAGNLTYNGAFSLGGSAFLALAGTTLTLGGTAVLPGYQIGGTVDITGSAIVNDGYAVGDNGEILVQGSVLQDGGLSLNQTFGTLANNGTLIVAAGGTYDLYAANGIGGGGTSDVVINDGLLEVLGGTGQSTISAPVTQAATATLLIGPEDSLNLSAGGTLAGSVTGAGGLEFGGTLTLDTGTTLGVASFFDNGTLIDLGNVSYAGAFGLGGGAVLSLGTTTLTLSGTASLPGYQVGGTVDITGSAVVYDNYVVNTNGVLLVQGTVLQTGGLNLNSATYGLNTDGTLIVAAGGTYGLFPSISGGGTSDVVINDGLFEVLGGTGQSSISAGYTQAATASLLITDGSLNLSDGGSLGGSIGGPGELVLGGGTFALQPGLSITTAALAFTSGTTTLLGSLSYGGAFALGGAALELTGDVLTLSGPALLQGSQIGGTIVVTGTATLNNSFLVTDHGTLVDRGLVIQDGAIYVAYAIGTLASDGTILIANGATFDNVAGNNINQNGTAGLVINDGLFLVAGGAGQSVDYGGFAQAGTATLDITTGSLNLNSGATLGGTVEGPGELVLSAGSFTLQSGLALSVATFDLAGGVATLGGALTYGGTFVEAGGTLNLGGETLTLTGAVALGSVLNTGGGTLVVTGSGAVASPAFDGGVTLLDEGDLVQSSNLGLGYNSPSNGTLVVASGATWDIVSDSFIETQSTAAAVVNAGLFEKTAATGNTPIDTNLVNIGTILVASGEITLSGTTDALGGTITGAGTLAIAGGHATLEAGAVVNVATLDVTGGTLTLGENLTYGGTFIGFGNSGTLSLGGHTLTLTAPASIFNLEIAGPGTLDVTGGGLVSPSYILGGGTLLIGAGLAYFTTNENFGYTGDGPGTLVVAAGATYEALGGATFSQDIASGGPIINAGLLLINDAAFVSNVPLVNTGTISVLATGSANFNQGETFDNDGLVSVAGYASFSTVGADAGQHGTFTVAPLSELVFNGYTVAASQTIAFTGASGELALYQLGSFDAAVSNFVQGDTIWLVNIDANGLSYNSGTGLLTVDAISGGVTTQLGQIYMPGLVNPGSLALVQDAGGGTDIVSLPAGTPSFSYPASTVSSDTWNAGTTGNWSTGSDWNVGAPPGALNSGILNASSTAYTVTINSNVGTIDTLQVNGGTLDITTGGTLGIDQGSQSGSGSGASGTIVQSGGLVDFRNGFNAAGPYTLASGATLEVDANDFSVSSAGSSFSGTITGGGTFDDNIGGLFTLPSLLTTAGLVVNGGGTVALPAAQTYAGHYDQYNGTLALGGHVFTLTGPATFGNSNATLQGPGTVAVAGSAVITSLFVDGGAMLLDTTSIAQSGALYLAYASGSDTGTLDIASGATYDIVADNGIANSGTGTVLNSGLFEKTGADGNTTISAGYTQAAGATLLIAEGLVDFTGGGSIAGTVAGSGDFYVNGGTLTLAASTALTVGTIDLQGGTVLAAGPLAYGGTFILNDTLNLAGTLALSGAATFANGAINTGTVITTGSGLIDSTFYIDDGAELLDEGSLVQSGANLALAYLSAADTGTLVIAHGATYDILTDSYIVSSGTALVINDGLFEKTGAAGSYSYIDPSFTQVGTATLLISDGLFYLQNGGNLDGLVEGAGTLALNGGTLSLASTVTLDIDNLVLGGAGTATLGGNLAYAGALTLGNTDVLLNGHTFTAGGTSFLAGTVNGAGTFVAAGSADTNASFSVNTGAVLLDKGLVTQASNVYVGYASPTDTGTLVVANGATYDILTDNYIYTQGTAAIVNDGLFEKTGGAGSYSQIEPGFTQAGTATLLIAQDTELYLSGGGSLAGTVEGAGELYVNGGTLALVAGLALNVGTLTLAGGVATLGGSLSYAGTFASAGTLALDGDTLTLGGPASLSGLFSGAGTVAVLGTATFANGYFDQGATLLDEGLILQTAADYIAYASGTDTGALDIVNGATYDIVLDVALNSQGAGSVTNAGLFEKTGGQNSYTQIEPGYTQTSTGTLLVGLDDALYLSGGGNLAGLVAGAGTLELIGGTMALASGVALDVATLDLSGGTQVVGGNLSYAGDFAINSNFNAETLELGGHIVTLSGSVSLGNATLIGPGTLVVASGVSGQIANFYVDGGAELLDEGSLTQTGDIHIAVASSTDTGTLVVAGGATYDLVTDNVIYDYNDTGNGSVINDGTFEKTAGGTGLSQIEPYFSQAATCALLVDEGALYLDNGGSLAGTVGGGGLLYQNGGTLAFAGGVALAVGALDLASGTATIGGNLSYGGTLTLANTLLLGGNTFTVTGPTALVNAGVAGGTLAVDGVATLLNSYVYGHAELVDSGTVTSTGVLYLAYGTATDTGTLEITATGTYDLLSDNAYINNSTGTGFVFNSGLFEKTGSTDNGTSVIYSSFDNLGTVLVTAGVLQFQSLVNDPPGTLTGGVYEATADGGIALTDTTPINTDAATIILSGPGSTFVSGPSTNVPIEQSLTSIAATGSLELLAGRNYYSLNTLTDAGALILAGGTFGAPGLDVAAGGTVTGFGTITAPVVNSGTIVPNAGSLVLTDGVTGSGVIEVPTAESVELGGAVGSGQTIVFGGIGATLTLDAPASVSATLSSLQPGDTIDLGGVDATSVTLGGGGLTIATTAGALTYATAGAASNDRPAVVSAGASGSEIIVYRAAAASPIAPAPVNFGAVHVGQTVTQGETIANTAPADGYSESLDVGIVVAAPFISPQNSAGLIAPGASSNALSVGIDSATDGLKTQNATINLDTDGTGLDNLGTAAIAGQTLALTGTVFAYAAPAITPAPLNFGTVRSTQTAVHQTETVANGTTADPYQESLGYSTAGTDGPFTLTNNSGTVLAGGTAGVTVAFNNATAGTFSNTATFALVSDTLATEGTLTDTTLAPQTVAISGTVYATATQSVPTALNFGPTHVDTADSASLVIGNTAVGAPADTLVATTAATTPAAYTVQASPTIDVAAGATGTLGYTLDSASDGTITGTTTLDFVSHDSVLSDLALSPSVVTLTGTAFALAAPTVTPTPINFGTVRSTQTVVQQTVTVANGTTADAYQEKLGYSTAGTDGAFTVGNNSGTVVSGGAADLGVGFNNATAGTFSSTATFALVSDTLASEGTLTDTALTARTVALAGTVYATATQSVPAALNFGQVHASTATTAALVIGNLASGTPADTLIAAATSTTPSAFTAQASPTIDVNAGGTGSLDYTFDSATLGTNTGTTTLGFASHDSVLSDLSLGTSTVDLAGTVFALAAPTITAGATLNFVARTTTGSTAAQAATIANGPSSAFQEGAGYTVGAAPTDFTVASNGSGTVASGSSASPGFTFADTTGGTVTGTVSVGLTSEPLVGETLAATPLVSQTITLDGTAYNTATAEVPTTVNLGQTHAGATVGNTITVANSAVAGTFSDFLTGSASATTAPFSVTGSLDVAAGSTGALSASLDTATLGTVTGSATLTLASHDNAQADLALNNGTVDLVGTVYALAAPTITAGSTLDFVTRTTASTPVTASATIVNGPSSAYQEGLAYAVGTPPADFSVTANGSGAIASGGSASPQFGFTDTTAGTVNDTVTVGLTSEPLAGETLAATPLVNQAVTLDGTAYATAAPVLNTTTLNFGEVHVGDTNVDAALGVSNAATGALTDALTGRFSSLPVNVGTVSTEGTLDVAAGGTGTLGLMLNTGSAEVLDATGSLSLFSHDSQLADLPVAAGPVTLIGTVFNYATAVIEVNGSVVSGGGTADLGTVTLGSGLQTLDIAIFNTAAAGPTDLLEGDFTTAGGGSSAFADNPGTFDGIGSGQSYEAQFVIDTSNYGTDDETVTLSLDSYETDPSTTPLPSITFTVQTEVVCFATGTRIRTARGEVPVEALRVGDLAVTASGARRPITWIGQRHLDAAFLHAHPDTRPVRVLAGAFGAGLPCRNLFLSPGHPVLVDGDADNEGGVLVPIMCLINGTSIARAAVDEVTYWHVELDEHDILLAEGLPAESFLDYGIRPWFEDGAEHALANPDYIAPGLDGRCRPVAIEGAQVAAERRRLDMLFAMRLEADGRWPRPGREDAWLRV